MCSIAGFYNSSENYIKKQEYCSSLLTVMNNHLKHRGPDAQEFVVLPKCCMAHTRLSIRDLKTGNQPMMKSVCGNQIYIVYNGEIYNSDELKTELISLGYEFSTTSDTEVLLHAFIHFGPDFIERVNGIFAFSIYDTANETIYLYRDHFGIKPLYYTTAGDDTLIFASEMKALFQYPGIIPTIDRDGLCQIFGIGPSKIPGSGVFKNILEVKPGHYIKMSKYGSKDITYYRIKSTPHTDSYEETIEKTAYLVKDSITRQIVSDVPVCTFLSGGIDSSIVSSICSGCLKAKGVRLDTFSFDFTDNSKYFKSNSFQPEQDRPYVELMCDYLNTKHTYLTCNMEDMADMLYESVISRDLPTMADVDSSLLYFCKQVANTHKVVLTGECADEIFGGYPWFYREELVNSHTFPWMKDISPRLDILKNELTEYLNLPEYIENLYASIVSEINMLPEETPIQRNRRKIGYINIRMFMQTLLDRMDRTSMYSGLEARVPFADPRIVDYVFNVPWEYKFRNNTEKSLLREAMRGYVPDEILFRKKSPYPKSYNPLYEEILCKRMKDVLHNGNGKLLELLDIPAIEEFLESPKDYGKPWFGQLMAGPQMIAYLIQIDYWITKYNIRFEL